MARIGRDPLSGRLVGACVALLFVLGASAFDSDKLYKYDLEATVSARVADSERAQLAVVAIQSKLLLRRSGANELVVRLVEPKMATANDLIEDLSAYKFAYKPIELMSTLDKPFRIYTEQGAVKSFDTYKDEAKWVTNFKRGLLSFFQLKLNTNSEGDAGDQQPGNQYYSASEKSVFGECETDYLVLSLPESRLNVTKTRNMAKCKTKFLHNFMPIDASECTESDKELEQFKHSNAIFNYHLAGTPSNYVVHQVTLDELSTYSPFNQRARSHQVQTRARLSLASAEGSSDSLAPEDGATRIDSLSYDPPEMVNFYANVNLDDAHHLANIYQTSASVEQVMTAMEMLVQEHKSYSSAFDAAQSSELERSRMAEMFVRLNELLGTLNSAKIEQLYGQADERGEAYKKIFWDVMSVAGTNPSFVFMKKLITEGDAPSVKIKDFLTRLSFHIKMPSKSLFDEYVNLCKSDKIQTNQQYKRLCSLPLASLIHQHCAKPHAKYLRMQHEGANATAYKKAQNTCQIATAEEYFSRLVAAIPPAGQSAGSSSADELSIGDRMFNIKMAGELGVRASIDYLMEVVKNKDEHPTVRSAAMWNLNKAARVYPAQVKRLVVPFYYDTTELLELRIAAFYNWFFSGISLHEMETLANQLAREPSRQLVLYVHSLMKSLAQLKPFPCLHGVDKSARLVLGVVKKALRQHSPARTDSWVSMSNSWLPDFGYGSAKMVSLIFSNESMAPSNVYYKTSEIMSGLKLAPMSVSFQAHGLDKLIKRVVGINGLLADKESFMDVFSLKRRSKRQVSNELIKQEAAEIDKELKLATRDFSDVYLSLTVSAYGRPVSFLDKDSRELKKMLSEDGTIKVPQIKKLLHSFNNHISQQMMIAFEKLEVFNNELGLPLYRSIQDFDYKTFKLSSVKLDVEPGFFKDERQGKPPTRLSAAIDARLARHNEMLIATGALLANSRQLLGAGFHKRKLIQVPLRVALEANLTDNKWALKLQPISDNLLYVKQQPVTFVKSYSPESAVSNSSGAPEWRPLYDLANEQHMRPFNLTYMTPLAVGVKLEGKHRAGSDWSMAGWRRYLSQNGLEASKFLYFYSPTGDPLEMRLSTSSSAENPTRELALQMSWHHHHQGEQDPLNEFEKELESQTSKSGDAGKPTTVSYRLALVGGSVAERLLALDINYSRSSDRLQHRWRAAYQRTPLEQANAGADVTNLCWLGSLEFPKHNVSRLLRLEPSLLDMDSSVRMSSELTFGDQCTADKADAAPAKVSAKVKFSWSPEQRAQVERALGKRSPAQQADAYQSERREQLQELASVCAQRRQKSGALLDGACLELLNKITELTQVEAEFDYRNVPERWVKLMKRLGSLYTYARAGYIAEMDERPPVSRELKSADGRNERAYLSANMTSGQGYASDAAGELSYQFDTPNYHVTYRNLPFSLPPLSTFPLLDSSYYGRLQSQAATRMCSVSGQTVSTFDNVTFEMPPVGDGCFKLITKDCSPESNFIVLGAKVGQAKVVKVYIAQRFKVEFVPDKDGKRISDVKVNGETVQLDAAGAPVARDTKLGARSVEAFRIENNGAFYTLSSKFYKFSVSTDGAWILVQQSNYYAGKSCGICGDANGDQLLELKSPSSVKHICKSTDDFVWSYVLPSTCASRPTTVECA